MVNKTVSLNPDGKRYTRKQRRTVFYTLMFALPILQFLLFYLYVNFNSIIMAFQKKVEIEPIGYETSFTWEHVKNAFKFFGEEECWKMFWNCCQRLKAWGFHMKTIGQSPIAAFSFRQNCSFLFPPLCTTANVYYHYFKKFY